QPHAHSFCTFFRSTRLASARIASVLDGSTSLAVPVSKIRADLCARHVLHFCCKARRTRSEPAGGHFVTQRKRVLFLINSLVGGGAERVMCTLLRHSEAEREEFDITLGLIDVEQAGNTAPDW